MSIEIKLLTRNTIFSFSTDAEKSIMMFLESEYKARIIGNTFNVPMYLKKKVLSRIKIQMGINDRTGKVVCKPIKNNKKTIMIKTKEPEMITGRFIGTDLVTDFEGWI